VESILFHERQSQKVRIDQVRADLEKERNCLQDLMHKLNGAKNDINMLLKLESERNYTQQDPEIVTVSLF
jgi:hypothetical protein